MIKQLWKHRVPYLFIAPFFIIYGVFMVFPVFYSLFLSFNKWNGLPGNPILPVGFRNYLELFGDPIFLTSITNMLIYAPSVIILGAVLSLIIALALNTDIRFKAFFRMAFFLPVITSAVVVALTWGQIFNSEPRIGLLNGLLMIFHLPPIGWLTTAGIALFSIVVMVIWSSAGYNAVLYLAGLQGIPKNLYEAAEIDGATPWQKFRYVTLPMLSPTTTFVVIMGLIYALQVFEPMQIMTRGGPENSTMSFVLYLYNNAFNYYYWGYASALAYVLFILIMLVTLIYFYLRRKLGNSFYEF